ncbi:MAG: family 16 glycoside hydrolase [Planctomycetota bacterium]|jgi:hypothetical protein
MKTLRMLGLIGMMGLASVAAAAQSGKKAATGGEQGFVTLFNGKDLSGWKTAPTSRWVVEQGALTLKDRSDAKEHNLEYLWTEKAYDNFILELEFKIPERANSGVFIRTSNLKDPVYTGIEVQVSNSYGRKHLSRGGTAGAIYDCLAPKKNAVKKPGEWNQMRVVCKDNKIAVVLNGEPVIDMDLDRWTEPNQNPDGSRNKFPVAIKDFARKGHIGLQDHGLPVWYRNIRIKELKSRLAPEPKFTLTPGEHGMVLKTPDDRVVFGYMTKKPADSKLTANSVCCLFPVNTPSGERAVDFAPDDHPHHRGVFLAWHSTKGKEKADFWGWGEWAPTEGRVIRNREVKLLKASSRGAVLRVQNVWLLRDDVMIREETVIMAGQRENAYLIGLRFRLTPTVDVTLDQTAFGGFCAKTRKDGKAVYIDPKGPVKLPDPHHLKPKTNWPAARWYDRTIKLDSGKTIGLAVLDHPDNPPATWHNLPPIAMVNPCIVAPGPVTIKKGETLVLNYGLVVHDGPTPVELLNAMSERVQR